ncbi:tolR [Wigglesworthia glossinidia endosymbiont of Glossina brevipalpis]|uniref:TolR protein n=1 Tax=Wigglesworthia glossinidia brevipalpis TaxID=36870 RepID=Q8D2E0_WIGBR|nr:tolR [Wigglesworthia glossinidia endosymbiont of Glossina brevipalpis]
MRYKLYKNIKYEINVIPLVDILLILMLIFMVFSNQPFQKINVNLPNSNTFNNEKDKSIIIIEVLITKEFNLITNKIKKENLNFDKLKKEINNCLILNSNSSFLIGGDKNIYYEEIIKIINFLKKTGVKSIGLATKSN